MSTVNTRVHVDDLVPVVLVDDEEKEKEYEEERDKDKEKYINW